jgi:hypothetical protein
MLLHDLSPKTWIDQQTYDVCGWDHRAEKLQPLAAQVSRKKMTPVAVSGRFMLVTRPALTGSSPTRKTSGRPEDLAALAARAAGSPAATITETGWLTSSAINDDKLPSSPRAGATSTATLTTKQNYNIARVGLNYQFGNAVVAKD